MVYIPGTIFTLKPHSTLLKIIKSSCSVYMVKIVYNFMLMISIIIVTVFSFQFIGAVTTRWVHLFVSTECNFRTIWIIPHFQFTRLHTASLSFIILLILYYILSKIKLRAVLSNAIRAWVKPFHIFGALTFILYHSHSFFVDSIEHHG